MKAARPRCCLCRATRFDLENSELPGTGWRCIDREKCRARVAAIIEAHKGLASIMSNDPTSCDGGRSLRR